MEAECQLILELISRSRMMMIQVLMIFLQFEEDQKEMEEEEDDDIEMACVFMEFSSSLTRMCAELVFQLELLYPENLVQALFPGEVNGGVRGRDVYEMLRFHRRRFWYLTSETPESFLELVHLIGFDVILRRNTRLQRDPNVPSPPRPTLLSARNRVLLVVIWLRHFVTQEYLAFLFGISQSIVSDEIHHVIPIMRVRLQNQVQWFGHYEALAMRNSFPEFPNVIGMIDATIHEIERPQHQGLYWRGDKRRHFVFSQIICDTNYIIRDVEAGFQGHLNDTRAFNISKLGTGIIGIPPPCRILADGGYPVRNPLLVPFTDEEAAGNPIRLEANAHQRRRRVQIENVIRAIKVAYSSKVVWRFGIEFQPLVVHVLCFLYNRRKRYFENM